MGGNITGRAVKGRSVVRATSMVINRRNMSTEVKKRLTNELCNYPFWYSVSIASAVACNPKDKEQCSTNVDVWVRDLDIE